MYVRSVLQGIVVVVVPSSHCDIHATVQVVSDDLTLLALFPFPLLCCRDTQMALFR